MRGPDEHRPRRGSTAHPLSKCRGASTVYASSRPCMKIGFPVRSTAPARRAGVVVAAGRQVIRASGTFECNRSAGVHFRPIPADSVRDRRPGFERLCPRRRRLPDVRLAARVWEAGFSNVFRIIIPCPAAISMFPCSYASGYIRAVESPSHPRHMMPLNVRLSHRHRRHDLNVGPRCAAAVHAESPRRGRTR